jgi:hypothetical protein
MRPILYDRSSRMPEATMAPAPVAQRSERRIFTPGVEGSTPSGGIWYLCVSEHVFVTRPRPDAPIPQVLNSGRPPDPRRSKPVELRQCRYHGQAEFGLYGIKRPQWRCKRCICEAVTRRHQRLKQILVDQAGGCCSICGYDRTVVNLHFHHVDPKLKSFNMTWCGESPSPRTSERQLSVSSSAPTATARSSPGSSRAPSPVRRFLLSSVQEGAPADVNGTMVS